MNDSHMLPFAWVDDADWDRQFWVNGGVAPPVVWGQDPDGVDWGFPSDS